MTAMADQDDADRVAEMTGLEILQRQQIGELTHERDTLKAENARLKVSLEEFDGLPERMVDLLRRNGYVFNRFPRNLVQEPPEGDGEKWEAMAFSLYSELMEVASKSRQALTPETELD